MDSIQRGEHAKRLLEDSVLKDALDGIEEAVTQLWKEASTSEQREELWFTLKGLDRFKTHLRAAVDSGEFDKQNRK